MHKRQRATGRDYFYPEDKCALWWGPNGTPASALIPLQVWVTARMDKSLSPLKVIGSRREKFGKKNQKLLAERAITIVFEKKKFNNGIPHTQSNIYSFNKALSSQCVPGTGEVAEGNSEHKSSCVRECMIQDRFMMKRSLEFLFVGIWG